MIILSIFGMERGQQKEKNTAIEKFTQTMTNASCLNRAKRCNKTRLYPLNFKWLKLQVMGSQLDYTMTGNCNDILQYFWCMEYQYWNYWNSYQLFAFKLHYYSHIKIIKITVVWIYLKITITALDIAAYSILNIPFET